MTGHYDTPEQEEKAKHAAELAQRRDSDAWQWLMSSVHGQRIARWLLSRAGLFARDCSIDDGIARFREGQRSIGVDVLTMVGAYSPQQFTTLFKDDNDE